MHQRNTTTGPTLLFRPVSPLFKHYLLRLLFIPAHAVGSRNPVREGFRRMVRKRPCNSGARRKSGVRGSSALTGRPCSGPVVIVVWVLGMDFRGPRRCELNQGPGFSNLVLFSRDGLSRPPVRLRNGISSCGARINHAAQSFAERTRLACPAGDNLARRLYTAVTNSHENVLDATMPPRPPRHRPGVATWTALISACQCICRPRVRPL